MSAEDKFKHMKKLVLAMVGHDHAERRINEVGQVAFKGPRMNPAISVTSTSAACTALKAEYQQVQIDAARPKDDPLLLELDKQYMGKILYDFDGKSMVFGGVRKKHKLTYRVVAIQWGDIGGPPYYEATCIPVVKGSSGAWMTAPECLIDGSETVYARKYELGVKLVSLEGPENPEKAPWADEYIEAHLKRDSPRNIN